MPKMIVNQQSIDFEIGQTVLQAARGAGFEIPTLCYHPAVEAYGACRLCVVEIIEGGRPGLTASCVLPATEGLKIETHSARVIRARKMIVQLLLGVSPDSNVLRELANNLGIEQPAFNSIDEKKCLLCGLCVRACQTVGNGAISFAFRGSDRKVCVPFDEQSEHCLGCLACVSVCPVEAIQYKVNRKNLKIDNWFCDLPMQVCENCGQPFATEKYVEFLQSKREKNEDFIKLCPICRGEENAKKLLPKYL